MAVLPVALFFALVFLQGGRGTRQESLSEIEQLFQEQGVRVTGFMTPSTPSPEDVDCYINIPTTQRVGGTCVGLNNNGGDLYWCRAGVHLKLAPECAPATPAPAPRRGSIRRQSGRRFRGSSRPGHQPNAHRRNWYGTGDN